MAALVDRIPTLESPRERRVHPHVPTSVPFLAMLGVCCTVPLAYHLLGLASHPFPAHTIVSTSMFAVVHALARRTFTPILFVPLIALVCEPYYIHLVLYPLVLMTMMLLEAHNASTLTNVAHDELFIPTGCVFALLAWIYRSGMWAPFPAALAMLLMTTIMYLKYRVRGLHYAAGFAVVSALLFINSLTESPALIERIAQLVVLLFPCIILLDIYMSAGANKTVVPAPPPSDQRAMLLAEISEKIREPLFAINTVLPGLKTGDEGKMRELETNVGLLMQLSQNVMKIVETEGTNQLVEGPFNLRTLIEDTLDAVSLNCTADEIDFIYSLDPDVNLDLIGDQGAVRQVLIELLGYCLKHTPSGEIRISVGLVAPAEGSTVDLAFRVIASGCRGLNPATEVLPLSYCHQLLRILRSQLSMHTSADELKFFFDLRVSINPVPPAEPDDLALSGGGSVLVLDDNKATRLFLSQELSSMGYHVESAADKTDAKRLLQLSVTSVLPYDVIIVDTHMDGVEFITQLKSEAEYSSLTPILMLSPSDRRRIDHIRAIAPQIRQMLQKPIRRSALLHAVRTALSSRVESSLSISRSMSNLNSVRKKKEGARRPSRVLVAEESPSGQAMMREVLNNLGFQTNLVTESAQLAKETLTGAYAAVLVNVSNRKFDPLPAVRQVRAEEERLKPHDFSGDAIEKSHVPIIAVSELPSEEEKQRCFELAMDGYISKPVDQDVLDSVLKDLQVVRSSKKRLSLSPAVPRVALSPRHAAQSAKQLLEQKLHAYVPKEFQELIAPNKSLDQVQLGDAELRCITIFFSDIRDFTAATEKMYVKDVMKFINAYLAFALPAITTHHGFIDKFIGDAIMALFTQADLRDQAVAAVSAAVKMQRDLDFMHACGFREATTGIGINTGPVIMGFIGTETRMSPTVLGDAVNLASRTEALCKTYGARVLITQHTLRQMAEKAKQFDIRAVDHVTVKGKEEPCKIYEVINGDADELRSKKLQILGDYNRAMDYFGEGKFGLALDLFESCSSSLPTDKPSLLYISRCKQLIASPPAHWDGIYHRTEKD